MAKESSKIVQLFACIAGIYVCYLWYGVVQEALYRQQADGTKFGATAFVMFVQCLGNAAVATIMYFIGAALGLEQRKPRKESDAKGNPEPLLPFWSLLFERDVVATAFVYITAMYTSNEALKYVSYPMQALAKSCKLVPVLIGGILINQKTYPSWKYLSVGLVTVGITAFQFAKSPKSGGGHSEGAAGDETFGLVLLAVSLAMDGMSGPGQERIRRFEMTNTQQMLATNIWATVAMFIVSLYYQQLDTSIAYLNSNPELWKTLFLFALTSAFGQLFIFYTIREFNSLILTTITTTRKFFTIVLSVVWFGNVMNTRQWGSVGIVFVGLVLDAYMEDRERHASKAAAGVTSKADMEGKSVPVRTSRVAQKAT